MYCCNGLPAGQSGGSVGALFLVRQDPIIQGELRTLGGTSG